MSGHHSLTRKLLHHPFFPLTSSFPPSQPPSISFPKYPFSTNQKPFFPSNPTPPPPKSLSSSSSLPTFPANISSLITIPSSHSSTTKLLRAIAFPILSLALLSLLLLLLFLFFRRRSRRGNAGDVSDSDRLFPPNSAVSEKPVSSEFLYLGTLVSSRGQEGSSSAAAPAAARSPELRPLPPLDRHVRKRNGDGGFSSEEEFYSPSVSPSEKQGVGFRLGSSSKLDFFAPSSSSSNSPPIDCSLKLPNVASFRPPPPPAPPRPMAPSPFVVLPPPPPPPPSAQQGNGLDCMERREELVKPKLKALHWDKVKASSDRAMVWDQMKSSSFQ